MIYSQEQWANFIQFYFNNYQLRMKKVNPKIEKKNMLQTSNRIMINDKIGKNIESLNKQQEKVNCRICLDQMNQQQINRFCLCKGTMSYVHQTCLLEWLKKLKQYQQGRFQYYTFCDVCSDKIYFKTTLQTKILTCDEVRASFQSGACQKQIPCTIASFIIVILAIFLLSMVIYLSVSLKMIDTQTYYICLGVSFSTIISTIIIYICRFLLSVNRVRYGLRAKDNIKLENIVQKVNFQIGKSNDQTVHQLIAKDKKKQVIIIQPQILTSNEYLQILTQKAQSVNMQNIIQTNRKKSYKTAGRIQKRNLIQVFQ